MDQDIPADMIYVGNHIVRSLVFFPYFPDDQDDVHYWIWTEDRKVLVPGGLFDYPSIDIEAFKSESGEKLSTWKTRDNTTNANAVPAPFPCELDNSEPNVSEEEVELDFTDFGLPSADI